MHGSTSSQYPHTKPYKTKVNQTKPNITKIAITQEKVFFICYKKLIFILFLLKIQIFEKIQLLINCALELAAICLACFCICHLSLENSSITVLYMSSFCKIVVSLSVRWRYELYHRFYENDKALSCNTTFLVRYFVINICS